MSDFETNPIGTMERLRPSTEPELRALYERDLRRNQANAVRYAMQVRPRGLVEQMRVLENIIAIANDLRREGRMQLEDVMVLRDLLFTGRLLMRVCVDKEFDGNSEALIEYLAAELAAEELRMNAALTPMTKPEQE